MKRPIVVLFATIRWNMSRIKDGWVINSLTSPRPTLESFKYQMPGEAGSDGYLYLFYTETKKYKQIKTSAYQEGNMAFEYHMPNIAEMAKDFFWRLADSFSEWLKGDSKRREGFYHVIYKKYFIKQNNNYEKNYHASFSRNYLIGKLSQGEF